MMVLVRDIPEEGLDLNFEADPAHLQLIEEGVDFEGLVQVELSASRQDATVFVTGRASARLVLECTLCLKKISYPLSLGIQAEYLSAGTMRDREEHELKLEDLDVIFYTGDSIEFDDLIREQIILSLPMHPSCSPSCRGLCPHCGRDLNLGDCGCSTSAPDPRFSVLKDYFKDRRR